MKDLRDLILGGIECLDLEWMAHWLIEGIDTRELN